MITHLALLEDCEHCSPDLYIQSTIHNCHNPEPAIMSSISQIQIILNCFSFSSISLSSNIFKPSILLHSIPLKAFSNIFFYYSDLLFSFSVSYLFLSWFFFKPCHWSAAPFNQESANHPASPNTNQCWSLHHWQ